MGRLASFCKDQQDCQRCSDVVMGATTSSGGGDVVKGAGTLSREWERRQGSDNIVMTSEQRPVVTVTLTREGRGNTGTHCKCRYHHQRSDNIIAREAALSSGQQ